MKKLILICSSLFLLNAFCTAQKKSKPLPVIFDSDMGPDYDDVGAIAMLHAYADSGYIKILATIASTNYVNVAPVFSVLNTYFNRPAIPIGVPKKNGLGLRDFQFWSDTLVARYPHAIKSNDEVPEAVEVYRKVLSAQADKSVTIITVGFLTNMADLLQSGPDQYSKLNGKELVQRKVKNLVCMAGHFPTGKEFNVEKDAAASRITFSQWPTPVLFSGVEIGRVVKVGLPLIANESIQNSPVKDVFSMSIPKAKGDSEGRMSWDETAVLIAVKGYQPYYNVVKGTMIVAEDGSNSWNDSGSNHMYLIENLSPKIVEVYIEKLISHQPLNVKR